MEVIIGLFAPMAILFLVMWLLLIKPQKKRENERKRMISEIKTGDEIVLYSGIIGNILSVDLETNTGIVQSDESKLKIDLNVIAHILNSAVVETAVESVFEATETEEQEENHN
ncbi:MAG: preprotein translocase subunit YajC [Mycoplasmatales bacterium]